LSTNITRALSIFDDPYYFSPLPHKRTYQPLSFTMGPSNTDILQAQIMSFTSKEEKGINHQMLSRKPFNLLVDNQRAILDHGEKVSVF
jgi:hypothetical protein